MSLLPLPTDLEAPITLVERTERIVRVLESAAMEVGRELLEAKIDHPGEFMEWVGRCLPFGIDKAERLMAITKAFANSDPEVQAALPPAWSALYELSRLPSERLIQAIGTGEVYSSMTVVEAKAVATSAPPPARPPASPPIPRITTDIVVCELLRQPRKDLSPSLLTMLQEWLKREEAP